jgi:RNA polymerase-binding protein DksA
MARSTRTSLAGQVASVARKAVGLTAAPAPEPDPPATRAPAEKNAGSAPRKRSAGAKAPAARKAPAKTPAKAAAPAKAAPTKAAASKTAPRKAAARKSATTPAAPATSAKATPVNTTAANTTPENDPATTAASAKKAPARKAPARKAAARKTGSARSASSTAAKAPVGELAVKEGEEAWTQAELKEVLDELHEQRDHSVEILRQQENELTGLMRDSGDGAGHDQADMGATRFERDHELTVLNIEREKVAQIDRALARIENGTYGVCESCGNPIGKMRVMAFPRATLCLTCKQREERR